MGKLSAVVDFSDTVTFMCRFLRNDWVFLNDFYCILF